MNRELQCYLKSVVNDSLKLPSVSRDLSSKLFAIRTQMEMVTKPKERGIGGLLNTLRRPERPETTTSVQRTEETELSGENQTKIINDTTEPGKEQFAFDYVDLNPNSGGKMGERRDGNMV